MAKKVAKTTNKKKATKTLSKKLQIKTTHEIDKRLIDNFVTLQKVIVNMSLKMDGLTNQLSKLLDLFEISAKSLAQKEFEIFGDNKETKEIREKIDNLFEQNKLIARGITLMNDKIGQEKMMPSQPQPKPMVRQIPPPQMSKPMEHRPLPMPPQMPRKLPQMPQQNKEDSEKENFGNDLRGYEKSLSQEENNQQENSNQVR